MKDLTNPNKLLEKRMSGCLVIKFLFDQRLFFITCHVDHNITICVIMDCNIYFIIWARRWDFFLRIILSQCLASIGSFLIYKGSSFFSSFWLFISYKHFNISMIPFMICTILYTNSKISFVFIADTSNFRQHPKVSLNIQYERIFSRYFSYIK